MMTQVTKVEQHGARPTAKGAHETIWITSGDITIFLADAEAAIELANMLFVVGKMQLRVRQAMQEPVDASA